MSHQRWALSQGLPLFWNKICCFFQALWVKSYLILQCIINLASFYIMACVDLFYTLAKTCYVSVLVPIVMNLRDILLVVCSWLWKSTQFLLRWTSTRIQRLLRFAWKHPGKALLRLCHWGYYVMVVLVQKDAYSVILRAIQYQLLFTVIMAFLDRLEALICKETVKIFELLLSVKSRWGPNYSVEACCISILPSNTLPLCQRFPGPSSPTMIQNFPSFGVLLVHVNKNNVRHFHMGVSEVLWRKIYCSRMREKTKKPQSSSHELMYEIKATFAIYFLLYLYRTFPSIKIIK